MNMALAACGRVVAGVIPSSGARVCAAALLFRPAVRCQSSLPSTEQSSFVPKTSLSAPSWPEIKLPDPIEEAEHHKDVVGRINNLVATGQFGRLFAVFSFLHKQWKVTDEDLVLFPFPIAAECGDRIRLEKILLVGSDDFTLIGKPILGKDLVRVEATVIEKTESCPNIYMKFWKRHRYQRKKILVKEQTILRINTIELAPVLS
ncbi:39S ribosomal protein L21, mitochondrial [Bombina bombina]|uniref:39S ribosomal protein L21, mitochondrial n=1 Tax=Bombina bombina TaxID=8345 RepID=UPI00235A6EC6|nr:39S ribosomal protein L21, mitochondrial [Bombina bombina]